jgi:hypothetical protein
VNFLPDRRAVAGADNGDDGNIGELELAFGVKQRRRRIHLGERGRISRLAEGNEACSEAIRRRELGLSFGRGAKADVGASVRAGKKSGSASIAASAPPNSLTRARKVAGPTFSLLINLSQAMR